MLKDLPCWFSPREIIFSKKQLTEFILPELNNLREGCYPSEPDEYITYKGNTQMVMKRSSYQGNRGKKILPMAHFVAAAEIAAEVDSRLKEIPKWWWVTSFYTDGFTLEEIAKFNKTTLEQIERELRRMVAYLAGWKRKRVDYNYWCRGKDLLDKVLEMVH
jgi:hypothetical protein